MAEDKEYRFCIDAYTPETFPMERLAEYMRDLAVMLGETKSVHFVNIVGGSTQIVHVVKHEAVPKVEARIRGVKSRSATLEALQAYDTLNEYLRDDNADAALTEGADGVEIILFPGVKELVEPEFGPFNQSGAVDGIVIKVGGRRERVPVQLQTRSGEFLNCVTTRALAKELGNHLFTDELRLTGTGRWFRDKYGQWILRSFSVTSFETLVDKSLPELAAELSVVEGAGWKTMDDPWAALKDIRGGNEDD